MSTDRLQLARAFVLNLGLVVFFWLFSGSAVKALGILEVTPNSYVASCLGPVTIRTDGTEVFGGTVQILFGGVPATQVEQTVSYDGLFFTCLVPDHAAGVVPVVIQPPSGPPGTLANGFTYLGLTIGSHGPRVLSMCGNELDGVVGTGFCPTNTVRIGGTDVSNIDWGRSTATHLFFYTPPLASGTFDLTIANIDGTSASVGSYYLVEPLTVNHVSPNGYIDHTGTVLIDVVGTGFCYSGVSVRFGNYTTTIPVSGGLHLLHCQIPADPLSETLDVVVTNPTGESFTLPDAFAFGQLPSIRASIAPSRGHVLGGMTATIASDAVDGVDGITFNGVHAELGVNTKTRHECSVPPGTSGLVDVVLYAFGQAVAHIPFTYVDNPEISEITPSSGSLAGERVRLTGQGFINTSTLTVDGAVVRGSVSSDGQSATLTMPARGQGGQAEIRVTETDGSSASVGYNYIQPVITSVQPSVLPTDTDSIVYVYGDGFSSVAQVLIGGVHLPTTMELSQNRLRANVAGHSAGTVSVKVLCLNSVSVTLRDALKFSDDAGPRIRKISPSSGAPDMAQAVVLYGEGLSESGTTRVLFDKVDATAVSVSRLPSYLTPTFVVNCVTPPGASGKLVDVTVINPDGTFNTVKHGYRYWGGNDTDGPFLHLWGHNPVLVPLGESYTDAGAFATDSSNNDLTGYVFVSGGVDTFFPHKWILKYGATGVRGNSARPITRTVYVEPPRPVVEPVPDVVAIGGFDTSRPGLDVKIAPGTFGPGTTLVLDRPAVSPVMNVAQNPLFTFVPAGTFQISGLSHLTTGGSLTLSIDFADGDQDGLVDDTYLSVADIVALAVNESGDVTTIIPTIDPIAGTATFRADGAVFDLAGAKGADSIVFALGGLSTPLSATSGAGLTTLILVVALLSGFQLRKRRGNANSIT